MSQYQEPTVYHYTGDENPSASPDADESVGGLAQAVDAAIDAVGDALDEGNINQAQAALTAADVASDALLEALGVIDADDMDN